MFSTMMIEASTMMPTEMAKPPSDIVLIPTPSRDITQAAIVTDNGSEIATMSVLGRLPMKASRTTTTRIAPMRMASTLQITLCLTGACARMRRPRNGQEPM